LNAQPDRMPGWGLGPEPATSSIGERQFRRVSAYIQSRTGIKMPATKAQMIEGRLIKRVREGGFDNIDAYCEHILSGYAADDAVDDFINAITTNKTDFFREPGHFDYLAQRILPELRNERQRRIRCWSAAASSGMEAYTLAMMLADFVGEHRDMEYFILATDIDTNVLAEARRGIYPLSALAPVPAHMRARYIANARDPRRKEARIIPELRRKVGFARLNLMDAQYPVGDPMDVIFCRNVLIYFERDTQYKVVSRLCDNLRPGGHLILGHSESIHGLDLPLTTVANTVFRKKG
jgi:chemotaxis protein methyltransferase CheR